MGGLARVNLLVGKNNSGKTAILEAISFLASGGAPSELAAIASRRGELGRLSHVLDDDELDIIGPELSHFFFGHMIAEGSNFHISGDNGYDPVGVAIAPLSTREAKQLIPLARHLRARSRDVDNLFPAWVAQFSGPRGKADKGPVGISPDGVILSMYGANVARHLDWDGGAQLVFVPTASLKGATLERLWRKAELDSRTESILHAIQLIVPDATRIVVIPGRFREAEWFLTTDGSHRPVPVGSFGDGVRRLLGLALAMLGAENGVFLVDEIDTGLHYSVMPDMWKMIAGTAKALNFQVFATTHSKDCIEGLANHLQTSDTNDDVAVHQINIGLDHSIPATGRAISRLVASNVEMR